MNFQRITHVCDLQRQLFIVHINFHVSRSSSEKLWDRCLTVSVQFTPVQFTLWTSHPSTIHPINNSPHGQFTPVQFAPRTTHHSKCNINKMVIWCNKMVKLVFLLLQFQLAPEFESDSDQFVNDNHLIGGSSTPKCNMVLSMTK